VRVIRAALRNPVFYSPGKFRNNFNDSGICQCLGVFDRQAMNHIAYRKLNELAGRPHSLTANATPLFQTTKRNHSG
jgi:hypothetical protein